MRIQALLAAAMGVSLALPAAAAEPKGPVAVFQTVCMRHQGDLAGAEAEALRLGLEIRTDNRGRPLADGDMEMSFLGSDENPYVLVLGPVPDRVLGIPGGDVTFCGVTAKDDGALLAAGKALPAQLGLPPPTEESDAYVTIVYRQQPGGVKALDGSSDEIRSALLANEFRAFDAQMDDGLTIISLTTGLKGSAR